MKAIKQSTVIARADAKALPSIESLKDAVEVVGGYIREEEEITAGLKRMLDEHLWVIDELLTQKESLLKKIETLEQEKTQSGTQATKTRYKPHCWSGQTSNMPTVKSKST